LINLFDLYNRFCSDNNTFQGGFFRPERDFEREVNTISQDIWNEWTAQAEKSQEINDNLSVFLKSINIIVTPTAGNYGLAKYPKPYGRYSAARILLHKDTCLCDPDKDTWEDGMCKTKGKVETEIEKKERNEKYKDGIVEKSFFKVESSRWASLLDHETKCPTFENPGLTQYDEGFKIAPRQVGTVILDFYVEPKYAKFAYTIAPGNPQNGTGDYIVYDDSNSGKLEWPNTMIPFFLSKLQKVYAKYTGNTNLFQMSKATT
jgi:hypothetical protein